MWRDLRKCFYRKSKLLTGTIVLVLGIVGMFTQYQFFCKEASNLQWGPLMWMEEDWYYYRSHDPQSQTDSVQAYIEENLETLPMREIRTLHLFDVFQYSNEAWQKFNYPLIEGDGFSERGVNEVIVSRGLAKTYPVGSKVEIDCYDNYNVSEGNVVESSAYIVVGVLDQESVFFRAVTGRGTFAEAGTMDMWSWSLGTTTRWGNTPKFCLVHPGKEWADENCYDGAAGVFFRASENELQNLQIGMGALDRISSVADILKSDGGFHNVVGYFRLSVIVVFWVLAVLFILLWYRYLLGRSKRELAYFTYIGFDRRALAKRYGVFQFRLLAAGWVLSCSAYLMPNHFDGFWRMHAYIPAVAAVLYAAAGVACFGVFVLIFKKRIKREGMDELLASDVNYLYMDDLTMCDNLKAILLAQGDTERAASKMVEQLLIEKELSYCAERRMGQITGDERLVFLACREKLREPLKGVSFPDKI